MIWTLLGTWRENELGGRSLRKRCVKAKLGALLPSTHGELVTGHWRIKDPFDLQDMSKGIRVRVHLNKHVLVKSSFW